MSNQDTIEEYEIADAKRWRKLCDMVNIGKATVTFMGRLDIIHTGLEVCDADDLYDEINDELEQY